MSQLWTLLVVVAITVAAGIAGGVVIDTLSALLLLGLLMTVLVVVGVYIETLRHCRCCEVAFIGGADGDGVASTLVVIVTLVVDRV